MTSFFIMFYLAPPIITEWKFTFFIFKTISNSSRSTVFTYMFMFITIIIRFMNFFTTYLIVCYQEITNLTHDLTKGFDMIIPCLFFETPGFSPCPQNGFNDEKTIFCNAFWIFNCIIDVSVQPF